MDKVIEDAFPNTFVEITDKINKINKNREKIKRLLSQNDKSILQLRYTKKELVGILTTRLEAIKRKKFLSLTEFLYPEKMYPEMINKSIADDFLFLFTDSAKNSNTLHPFEISALYIYSEISAEEPSNFKQYSEEEVRKGIDMTKKHNWIVQLENADSLRIVRKDGVLVIPTFTYLLNGRKSHSKMKINNVIVFKRNEDTEELFKLRDIILSIMRLKK